MYFFLRNLTTDELTPLLQEKTYTVGRKNADILLENDQSISRTHAIIKVEKNHVLLQDAKSKYHTLYNEKEMNPTVPEEVKHLDKIQFGKFNYKYQFEAYKFITTASGLKPDQKKVLKANIQKCGGLLLEKWSDICTHLTIEKVTLTVKLLQALIDAKPMVIPEYWAAYAESVAKKTGLPDINKFNRPPIVEQLLRKDFEFVPNPLRRTLFENKVFVFLQSKTKNQMEEVIKNCRGDSIAFEEQPKTFQEMYNSPKEHLIIKETDDEETALSPIISEYATHQKRAIPLNEIALAVIYCSCATNCNPSFNKANQIFKAVSTQKTQAPNNILVMETQTENSMPLASQIKTEKEILPTLDDGFMNVECQEEEDLPGPSGVKRPAGEQILECKEVVKKPKVDQEKESPISINKVTPPVEKVITPSQSQKRKTHEDGGENPFASMQSNSSFNKKSKTHKDDTNPFEFTRKPQAKPKTQPLLVENPFAEMLSKAKPRENIRQVKKEKENPAYESNKSSIKKDDSFFLSPTKSILNATWFSKGCSFIKKIIKEENPELAALVEAFKDCVQVTKVSVVSRKLNTTTCTQSVNGKKNFKAFKKVPPLKPQVTIIDRSHLKKVCSENLSAIPRLLNVSDDNEAPVVRGKNKPLHKQFDF